MKRQYFLNALLVLFSLFISLLLLEKSFGLYLRLTKPEPPMFLQPGIKQVHNLEFEELQTIESSGFRQSFFRPNKDTKKILLLGDSFVFGTGLNDNETFAWQLNKNYSDQSFQFFNAGIPKAGINDYGRTYKNIKKNINYQFEMVIIFVFIGNDIYDYQWVFDNYNDKKTEKTRLSIDLRTSISILENYFPVTLGFVQKIIKNYTKNVQKTQVSDLEAIVDHLNVIKGVYGKSEPLTEAEKQIISLRFNRIESEIREAIVRQQVNPWLFLPFISPPLFNDFVYNLDSNFDLRQIAATMEQLDLLINSIDEQVGVVIVPDKFQVCAAFRQSARQIMGTDYPGDEFLNLLRINDYITERVTKHHPDTWVLDLADIMGNEDACRFYYDIDCHFRPAGADLVVRELTAHFSH